jgi:hypothetical protein
MQKKEKKNLKPEYYFQTIFLKKDFKSSCQAKEQIFK